MPILTCKNLCIGYDGKEILHNINFTLNSGDYLCIIGENGSGKTTFMKTILGLKKPISGSVYTGDGLLQTEIGYMPQQTMVQRDFPATVWEIVLSGCENKRLKSFFYRKEERGLAEENLKRMEIENLRDCSYRNLSGGQQQRVLLARALCATKKMLLLDEPVSGLDAKTTKELYKIIENLNKEGITVIMITHNTGDALNYASHVLHIDKNSIYFGTKDAYLKTKKSLLYSPSSVLGVIKSEELCDGCQEAEDSKNPEICPYCHRLRSSGSKGFLKDGVLLKGKHLHNFNKSN